MTTETALATGMTDSQKELIKRTVAKGATDDELDLFIHYCQKSGMDPLRKQAHFIVRKSKNKATNEWERSITMMIGIDGFQKRATQDPNYLGIIANAVREKDVFLFDAAKGEITHQFKQTERGKLIGAYAMLKRKGMEPALCWVSMEEYGQDNFFWNSKGEVLIVKTARATLLRREYPDTFSGVYEPSEFGMELTEHGEVNELNITPPKPELPEKSQHYNPETQDNPHEHRVIPNNPLPYTKKARKASESPKIDKSPETEGNIHPKGIMPETYLFPPSIIKDTPAATFDRICSQAGFLGIQDKVMPTILSIVPKYSDEGFDPDDIPDKTLIEIIFRLTGVRMEAT
jgi:phage recombination protein Bet